MCVHVSACMTAYMHDMYLHVHSSVHASAFIWAWPVCVELSDTYLMLYHPPPPLQKWIMLGLAMLLLANVSTLVGDVNKGFG